MAYIGVTSTVDSRVETPEEIAQMLIAASKYIPVDQLGATDGKSPRSAAFSFSSDVSSFGIVC